jgi:hypothetical protein
MIAALGGVLMIGLSLTSVAHADGGWVLWARTCDLRNPQCGAPWSRSATFEAERWCRAARTIRTNDAMRETAETGRRTIREYQCQPDGAPPPEATATK